MYLLDTHVLLWWLLEPEKLTTLEYEAIENQKNDIYISAASIWEIAIKASLKKLSVPDAFQKEIDSLCFNIVSINSEIAWGTKELPLHHADPFDRLIIATAKSLNLTLITHDRILKKYDIAIF